MIIRIKQIFFSLITIFIATYFSIFILNYFLQKFEVYQINKKIKHNYSVVEKTIKENKEKYYLNYFYSMNHQNYSMYNKLVKKHKVYPLSSASMKKVFLCNESGENVFIRTDKYGFRNFKDNYQNPKNIIIGDSFGLGICHPDKNFFINLLPYEFLNLSQGGTSSFSQAAILREYANFNENTNLYWLFFLGNDLEEIKNEFENSFLKKYKDTNFKQNLITKDELKNNFINEVSSNNYFSNVKKEDLKRKYLLKKEESIFNLLKISYIRNKFNRKFIQIYSKELIDLYIKVILETKKNLNIKNLTVIILPDQRVFLYKDYRKLYMIEYIKTQFKKEQIDTIDLPLLFEDKDFFQFFLSYNSHYSENGNKLLAEQISRCIKKLQKCN